MDDQCDGPRSLLHERDDAGKPDAWKAGTSGLGEGSRKRTARHLVGCPSYKNATEALERYLARKHAALRQATEASILPAASAPADSVAVPPEDLLVAPAPAAAPPEPRSPKARLSQARRARRVARYEEVMALHATGASIRAIARATHLNKRTV
jgi:hypothetical protein